MKIFNPSGSDLVSDRQLWRGNSTNLMNLNNVKYDWAIGLWRQMRENFWVAEKIGVSQDVNDYVNLTMAERRGYDGILSYLTFLDSVQVMNLPNLKLPITAPELHLTFSEQQSQEALHDQSYQYLIQSIIPSERRNKVYDFWRTDKVLEKRCEFIANLYQQYVDNPTEENYFVALIADYLLEGIYFYNGFVFYYNLASRQLMSGSADIFKLINR